MSVYIFHFRFLSILFHKGISACANKKTNCANKVRKVWHCSQTGDVGLCCCIGPNGISISYSIYMTMGRPPGVFSAATAEIRAYVRCWPIVLLMAAASAIEVCGQDKPCSAGDPQEPSWPQHRAPDTERQPEEKWPSTLFSLTRQIYTYIVYCACGAIAMGFPYSINICVGIPFTKSRSPHAHCLYIYAWFGCFHSFRFKYKHYPHACIPLGYSARRMEENSCAWCEWNVLNAMRRAWVRWKWGTGE